MNYEKEGKFYIFDWIDVNHFLNYIIKNSFDYSINKIFVLGKFSPVRKIMIQAITKTNNLHQRDS